MNFDQHRPKFWQLQVIFVLKAYFYIIKVNLDNLILIPEEFLELSELAMTLPHRHSNLMLTSVTMLMVQQKIEQKI